MAQVTGALSINNGAATPVAKSFAPQRVSPDLSVFEERSAAMSAGFIRLSLASSSPTSQRPTTRIDIKLDLPVVETVDGVAKVTRTGRFSGYFVVPDTMTASERADLAAFTANALDNALIRGVVKDLDPLY